MNAVLADPRLQARFAELGGTPMPMTPAEFGDLLVAETEKWAKVGEVLRRQAGVAAQHAIANAKDLHCISRGFDHHRGRRGLVFFRSSGLLRAARAVLRGGPPSPRGSIACD